ncbi:hypothetical protein FLL57_18655 [Rhodopseudomonas palustris]|uniref:hypothetical protein n=1 Tax=Rhodopseudomonas palustris TaxID=1076 RepID=UPI00115D1831|nr:hypothetical protein [Rhodopseudomonas palustris]QDL99201.1 hypothetical protein FLL57_18655 [Rhodopseudomonas palustris]
MTKAITLSALACVLLASASAASILSRASVPAAGSAGAAAIERPVANRDVKADKLGIARPQLAASEPELGDFEAADFEATDRATALSEADAADTTTTTGPVRLAYATDEPPVAAIPEASPSGPSSAAKPVTKLPPVIATTPVQKPKPKPAAKEALLSDGQIAQIKTRLNLSSSQEYYWPSVEQALRAIGRKLHAASRGRGDGAPPIDPDSAEVQQLKFAAMPLLFQLREDQKQEVRKLARTMGLEQVAQQI